MENATLCSRMIELSEKQASILEQLEGSFESKELEVENARTLKREMVQMYARVMGNENHHSA